MSTRPPYRCKVNSVSTSVARARNRRGEGSRLRDEIVAAATQLIDTAGSSDAVTLRAVAREVGIAAPSIYAHFADREEILTAVVADTFDALAATLRDATSGVADPVARLRAGCRAYVDFAGRRPQAYQVLFACGPSTEPLTREELLGADAFGQLVTCIAQCVEAGVSTSAAAGDDATALWVALHGYAGLRSSSPGFPWPAEPAFLDGLIDRLAWIAPAPATGPRSGRSRTRTSATEDPATKDTSPKDTAPRNTASKNTAPRG
jgi:AcrR family transcriptional regulator